jgi:hypothetical protein
LLVERPDDPQLNEEFRHKRCRDEQASEASVDSEMNATINAHLRSTIWNLHPLPEPIEDFGRFMRFDALLNIATGKNPDITVTKKIDMRRLAPGADKVLMAGAPRPFESVDNTESYFSAYCTMTPSQRTELITALIKAIDQFTKADAIATNSTPDRGEQSISVMYSTLLRLVQYAIDKHPANWEEGLATLQPEQLSFIRQSLFTDQTDIDRFLIYQRNRTWMQQLPSYLTSERLPFYVLGGFHFLDGPAGPGLISMLRQSGFTVTLVKDRKELNGILAMLPKAETRNAEHKEARVTEIALSGKCVLIPNNYNCGWSDGNDFVNVTKKSSTEESMTVCIQHKSVYGPITNCVATTVPIPPERAKDLLGSGETEQSTSR